MTFAQELNMNILKKRYKQEALFIKIITEKNYRNIELYSENQQWLHQIQ